MTHPPAGWFPDPEVPGHVRYWDGAAWTTHRAEIPAHLQAPPHAVAVRKPVPTTPDGQPLAGWGMRLLAQFIDGITITVVTTVFTLPWQIEFQRRTNQASADLQRTEDIGAFWQDYGEAFVGLMPAQLASTVLVLAYLTLMLRWKGATLGKLAVGLRVRLRDRPGQLSWGVSLGRALLVCGVGVPAFLVVLLGSWTIGIVLWLVVLLYLFVDGLWPLMDPNRQALHDKVVRTNVVELG